MTLVIAHLLEIVGRMDRILVLDQSRIMEDGPPVELMARDGSSHRILRERQILVARGLIAGCFATR